MGESSEEIAACSCGGEVNGLLSCQAHHVAISTTEDRGGCSGTMGKDKSGEEGGLAAREACCEVSGRLSCLKATIAEAPENQFATTRQFTPKPETKEEIVNVVRKEILPILKKQQGFMEFLPLVPETKTEKWINVTLWAEKRDAERYEREVYPKVEGIIKPYLLGPLAHKHYNVEASLCKHFVEVLTA